MLGGEIQATLTQRRVKERFTLFQTQFKEKEKEEMNASGIYPESDELDILLGGSCEREIRIREKEIEFNGKEQQNKANQFHAIMKAEPHQQKNTAIMAILDKLMSKN